MYTPSFLFLFLAPWTVSSFTLNTKPTSTSIPSSTSTSALQQSSPKNEVDVSDLGLTMKDFETPLPKEFLSDALTLSGYQSTSRITETDDKGCNWVETADEMDVTLQIPGLRGQPAASLSVMFSTTTVSITAFGMVVWSAIQMGYSDPDDCSFITEDGEGMVPVVHMTIKKRDVGERWGGFILQVGEDSIL